MRGGEGVTRASPVPRGPRSVSTVIPAFNERTRLPDTLRTVHAYFSERGDDFEIIIVDDGSTDDTVALAEELAGQLGRVEVLREPHRGKGATVRAGMLHASRALVLFTDADLSTPIGEAERLLSRLESGYDIAIGSREGKGAQRLDEPAYRHLMGRAFNALVRAAVVGGIQDTQCGFKAFRREVARDLFNRVRLYGADAPVLAGSKVTAFDVEILFLARKRGYQVVEVPVEWRHDPASKVNAARDSAAMLRDVLQVRINDLRGQYR